MGGQKSIWSYIKGYRFNSLLLKNFAYVFILVTVPLLLVLTLNYNNFNDVIDNRVMEMNEELLQQSSVVTDNIINDLLSNLNQVTQQNTIMEVVQLQETNPIYYDRAEQTVLLIKEQIRSSSLIVSAWVYSDLNNMLIDSVRAIDANRITIKDKWYHIHKQNPMVLPYILVDQGSRVFICQPVWSAMGQRAGLFVLEVDFQNVRDMLERQEAVRQGSFFVIGVSGQTIYCNEQDSKTWTAELQKQYETDIAKVKSGQSQIIGQGKHIISVMDSEHKSWRYAFVTEFPDYEEETSMRNGFLISSVTVGFLTSLIVAYIITALTYRPIRKIINVIQNPQLHWSEKEATKESNELLYIASNILATRDDNEDISQEVGDRIRSLRQAQFRALQFQIDPHFLYNTLETIKWTAVEDMGLGNKTSKMLTKVARLYRLGLENDDVIVPLKEELDFLKLYIEIVRIRFGDSIQFHWDIDESLYECSVIKMCLQPIVENAIQHGLRPKNYHGNITVSAYYKEECLYICVTNDGQDMSQTEMKKLNEKLKTGAGFEESKVGLRNVNERIKLIYGKKYGVSIHRTRADEKQSAESDGDVRVVLTFPCRNFIRSEETK